MKKAILKKYMLLEARHHNDNTNGCASGACSKGRGLFMISQIRLNCIGLVVDSFINPLHKLFVFRAIKSW